MNMNHTELLKRLLLPVAYDANAPLISAELVAEGNALDAAQLAADSLVREADPSATYQLLADWERVLGLPDDCVETLSLTINQRLVAVKTKFTSQGGQSRAFFIGLAASLGIPGATIDEFKPASCNSNCNAQLWSQADRFAWRLNLSGAQRIKGANCNSNCNAQLQSWAYSAMLECIVNKFKPAHTTAIFNYY